MVHSSLVCSFMIFPTPLEYKTRSCYQFQRLEMIMKRVKTDAPVEGTKVGRF